MNFLSRKKSESVEILNKKGYELNQLGKHSESIECYDEVLTVEPNNLLALKNKGFALKQLGKHEDALECIQRASNLIQSKK